MLAGILGLAFMILMGAILVIWIRALAESDGSCPCDESECETCPFPCEGRNKRR